MLIEVNPLVRIPRTFKRFSGLMGSLFQYLSGRNSYSFLFTSVQLLHKLSIRGVNGPENLLKVIKVSLLCLSLLSFMNFDPQSQNPVVDHLPPNTVKISMFRSLLFFPPLNISFLCTPALSGDCPTQRLSKYLPTLPTTHNIAVFVGAMARGRDDFADAYVDEKISISEYSLSASVACGKVFFFLKYSLLYLGSTNRRFFFSFVVRWKNSGTLSNPSIFLPICASDILAFIQLCLLCYS